MGDEYPCPHCGAMNPESTGYLRITCHVCGGQYEAKHFVSSTSIAELAQQVMENEATNRYEALGMALPDPGTMCPDECEGTGWMPVKADDPNYAADWAAAEAAAPTDDGWHFVKCHTCGGTGIRHDR